MAATRSARSELKRLAGMSDEAFAATEAAYERMAKQAKAETSDRRQATDGRGADKKAAKACDDQPLRSDAGVRPRDVDDRKVSLEDRLRERLHGRLPATVSAKTSAEHRGNQRIRRKHHGIHQSMSPGPRLRRRPHAGRRASSARWSGSSGNDLFAVNTDPTVRSFGILIKDYDAGDMPGIYCDGGVYETDVFEGTINAGDDLKVSADGTPDRRRRSGRTRHRPRHLRQGRRAQVPPARLSKGATRT